MQNFLIEQAHIRNMLLKCPRLQIQLRMPYANNCAVQARAIKACCHYIDMSRLL